MRRTAICPIIGSATLLAAMGVVFCWMCPAGREVCPSNPHWMVGRMVVGNLVGLALGGFAASVAWRHWLKAAPYVCATWIGLLLYAATLPPANGSFGWMRLGQITFSVWEALPLVVGLMAAWVSWKFNVRSIVALLVLAVSFLGGFGTKIMMNENRMQRIKNSFVQSVEKPQMNEKASAGQYIQNQCAVIIRESSWFGKTEFAPKILPCAATAAMPAEAAALYGKWYLVFLCAVLALLGAGFAMAWASTSGHEKRSLVLVLGLSIVGVMVASYLGCVMVTPMPTCGVPWASYGGSMAALYWLALGVLVSALLDNAEPSRELSRREVWTIAAAALLWTILLSCPICRLQSRTDIQLYGSSDAKAS